MRKNVHAHCIGLALLLLSAFSFPAYAEGPPIPWLLVLALFLMPAWSWAQFNIVYKTYDASATSAVLQKIQDEVEEVNARGGKSLFITQRHLISMHMLDGVTLVPEQEREQDLMEMAMSNNTAYLDRFKKDMQDQRFDLIVVDPLKLNLIFRNRSFSEENNVWVRRVMRSILCNYREETAFPTDDISLYVPQEGERACPQTCIIDWIHRHRLRFGKQLPSPHSLWLKWEMPWLLAQTEIRCGKLVLFSNKAMLGSVLLTFALQLAVIYVPFLNRAFSTTPLSLRDLLISLGFGAIVFLDVELFKWIQQRQK